MLHHIDRVQIVTPDGRETAAGWLRLLGAAIRRQDKVAVLGARRTVIGLGTAEIEFLEPDGAGIVADFMQESGRGGLFAAGFAVDDLAAAKAHLTSLGAPIAEEGGQLFVHSGAVEGAGFRAVLTPNQPRERTGVMTRLHEVSFLTPDPQASAASLAKVFTLDPANFGPAESDAFGFRGIHVNLTSAKAEDIETIFPYDTEKTMGRFFARRGSSLYMCFGESDQIDVLRDTMMSKAPDDWTGPREGAITGSIFIHPKPLGGVMLGVRAVGAGGH